MLQGKAYAKLNLTLDIVGAKNGYHMLDSLVTTVDCFDGIAIEKRNDKKIVIQTAGRGSESIAKNNAAVAAEKFLQRFHTTGANVWITKNIPVGAGMGGSSADSAGVLRLLSELYGVTDREAVKELADACGSDTGYLLMGGFARLRGRGEQVEKLSDVSYMPPVYFLVLVPKSGVSTPQCFRAFDEGGMSATPCTQSAVDLLISGDFAGAARFFSNALTGAAQALNAEVAGALKALKAISSVGVSMTGSGSACFLACGSREECERANSLYRGDCETMILKSVQAFE